jgi:hypothetical protein
MKKVFRILAISLVLVLFGICALPAAAQPPIGGDQGWYAVHCNVDGANVYFDGDYKGVIQGGVLYVAAYTTGTPYSTYSVQMDGYTSFSDSIPSVPGKGETLDLYATLNPVQPTQPVVIGGDIGWYTVHCNVDGAMVMFDNEVKGTINQGILSVQVYTTGTPYKTFTVTMNGYTPYTATIDRYPGKGETVDLYATLNPVPTPTPTRSPMSPFVALSGLAVAALVLGMVHRRK